MISAHAPKLVAAELSLALVATLHLGVVARLALGTPLSHATSNHVQVSIAVDN